METTRKDKIRRKNLCNKTLSCVLINAAT